MAQAPSQSLSIEDAAALAAIHHREGRLAEALALYGPLQAARPTDPNVNGLLGTVLAQLGRLEEAILFLTQADELDPGNPETLNNLATTLELARRLPDAADVWNRYGSQLYRAGRLTEAIPLFGKALALVPGHAGAGANMGATLQSLGRHREAVEQLSALLAANPGEMEAHNNLGNAQMGAGAVEESIASYRRAIALGPDYFEAYSNLGLALAMRQPDGMAGTDTDGGSRDAKPSHSVRACYEKALTLRPNFPAAQWNLGICLLLQGDFEQGWKQYEWRWQWDGFGEVHRPFAQPVWQGEPPPATGGTLLVTAEQGFGDTIQFARYLPLLVEQGHEVVLEVQVPLYTLLWHSLGRYGVRVVPRTESPDRVHDDLRFDRYVPLMSLPARFGTRLEDIPGQQPYLFAEPTRETLWADRLAAAAGPRRRVGLAWRGRPMHARDRERSMPASALAPLLEVPDVQFFSLHKNDGGHPPGEMPAGIVPLDGMLYDFSETAAVLANLDLVITVDTSVAHLAGAMGRPVWVLLPFSPDWRWLLGRSDSPWYPGMTLFRQRQAGDWDGVIAEVARRLSDWEAVA